MMSAADWTAAPFRSALVALVRRSVPDRDVEDVVQSVLAEAVASPNRPEEPESARRWIWGIARHKVADHHRRARRERLDDDPPDAPVVPDEAARTLLDWAVRELPPGMDSARTLAWLLREADGEKLEEIAEAEGIAATQVRQRVSRMRRWFRERHAAQAAVLVALGLGALALWVVWRGDGRAPRPELREPAELLTARARGRALRRWGLADCRVKRWAPCLDALDRARALDPAGDDAEAVRAARGLARAALDRDAAPPAPAPVFESAPDGGATDGGVTDGGAMDDGATGRGVAPVRRRRAGDGGVGVTPEPTMRRQPSEFAPSFRDS